jgi:hypothetical protein
MCLELIARRLEDAERNARDSCMKYYPTAEPNERTEYVLDSMKTAAETAIVDLRTVARQLRVPDEAQQRDHVPAAKHVEQERR